MKSLGRVCCLVGLLPLVGCKAPEPLEPGDLEIVSLPDEERPPPPEALRYRLVASCKVVTPEKAGPLDLWLPLPVTTPAQMVESLAWELGPPGSFEVETNEAGDRLLHVRSDWVRVRAEIKRPASSLGSLEGKLAEVDRRLGPEAWVEAARERGMSARLVHGVVVSGDGACSQDRWPEVRVGEDWQAVDLVGGRVGQEAGKVRLATVLPRAEQEGRPLEVKTSYRAESQP